MSDCDINGQLHDFELKIENQLLSVDDLINYQLYTCIYICLLVILLVTRSIPLRGNLDT